MHAGYGFSRSSLIYETLENTGLERRCIFLHLIFLYVYLLLRGDMAIVGPRAERPEIATEYHDELPEFALRLQTKVGLTGYAQVYGKYNTSPYDKLLMDMMYGFIPDWNSFVKDYQDIPRMKITVAGVGYVGLSLAVLLAQNHDVTAITTTPPRQISSTNSSALSRTMRSRDSLTKPEQESVSLAFTQLLIKQPHMAALTSLSLLPRPTMMMSDSSSILVQLRMPSSRPWQSIQMS